MRPSSFGDLLRDRRRVLDWTQEELAEQVGCARGTIYKLEAGQRRPSKTMLLRLAEVLQIPSADYERFARLARMQGLAAPEEEPLPAAAPAPAVPPPPAPLSPQPLSVPVPLTPLIGQEALVAELSQVLRTTAGRLLTLTGAPGIGKTRLALELATLLRDDFPDGVAFVPLSALTDAALVPSALAQALGLPLEQTPALVEHLCVLLRPRQTLLVLDNFEHVIAAAPLVSTLLSHAPGLRVLVTSREVLRLSGEREVSIPPLALPALAPIPQETPAAPDQLAAFPAIRLFVQRAQEVRPSFQLSEENALAVAQICACLDGLPLAIALAAAQVKLFSPRAMLAQLTAALTPQGAAPGGPLVWLRGGPRDAPSRQQTLSAAIAWSYHLLPPAEQHLFARLAVFVGGFTLEAALAVCASVGSITLEVVEGLSALVNKSLVQQAGSADDEPRFLLLETIRHYALSQLATHGEEATLRQQHAAYFLMLAREATQMARGTLGAMWVHRLDREHGNLRAALDWCHRSEQGDAQAVMSLAQALGTALHTQTRYTEAQDVFEAMCLAAEAVNDQEAIARACNHLAWVYDRKGGHREALESARRAEAAAHAASASVELAKALSRKSQALYRLGDLRAALTEANRGIEISTALGAVARPELAANLNSRATTQMLLNQPDEAAQTLTQALEIYRALGDQSRVSGMLNNLGENARLRGDYHQAVAFYREALHIAQKMGDRNNEILIRSNLGGASVGAGDYETAERDLCALIAEAEASKWVGIAESYTFLAEAYLHQGKYPEALAAAQRALTLAQAHEEVLLIGSAWRVLGMVLSQGAAAPDPTAISPTHCFAEGLRIFSAAHMAAEAARTLRAWARAARYQGDQTEAARLWHAALDQFAQAGVSLEIERMRAEQSWS